MHDVRIFNHGVVNAFQQASSRVPIGVSLQQANVILNKSTIMFVVNLTLIEGFLEIFWNTLSNLLKIVTNAGLMASLAHSVDGKM